jgi:tyrosinase
MQRHGPVYEPVEGGPEGHNLNDPMWPYTQLGMTVTPAMMLDSRTLGYVYDTDL